MTRRTMVSMLGLALLALSVPLAVGPAFAKDGSGGGGDGKDSGGDASKGEGEGDSTKSSATDQPGTEAQPEAATECAAGTDCTPK